jgi:regulator of sigma E protease
LIHIAPDVLRTTIAFLVVLGVLVFIHESGHYLAARWRGVFVETFSIGFGRALATWRDHLGTEWKLAWVPLGGYVKLHGQERPDEVSPQVRATWIPGRTFQEKSVGSRAIVVAAGPIANFALAIVLFSGLFATIGRPVLVPVVNQVEAGSSAAHAGIKPGDRIEAVDGHSVPTFSVLQSYIAPHPGEHVVLRIKRENQDIALPVVIGSRQQNGQTIGLLGVESGQVSYQHLSVPAAIAAGFTETWRVTAETAHGVAQIFTAGRGASDIGGPLRIAQLSGQVAALGFASFVSFIAILSVNLGLINLLPIPILDGGHLLFFLFEALFGRPLPPRAREYGFRAGLALLGGLFVFATWNDLLHLGLSHWFSG